MFVRHSLIQLEEVVLIETHDNEHYVLNSKEWLIRLYSDSYKRRTFVPFIVRACNSFGLPRGLWNMPPVLMVVYVVCGDKNFSSRRPYKCLIRLCIKRFIIIMLKWCIGNLIFYWILGPSFVNVKCSHIRQCCSSLCSSEQSHRMRSDKIVIT